MNGWTKIREWEFLSYSWEQTKLIFFIREEEDSEKEASEEVLEVEVGRQKAPGEAEGEEVAASVAVDSKERKDYPLKKL